MLGGKPCASTLRHLLGQFAHGLLRDRAAFATGQGRFRLIDGDEDFRTRTFALLPQRKSFYHRVFFASKTPAGNRLPDKGPLAGGELHFHICR